MSLTEEDIKSLINRAERYIEELEKIINIK